MKVEATVEDCEECSGTGKISYERPEPWICRDSPPSLEEVTGDCDECGGLGTVQVIHLDSESEKLIQTINAAEAERKKMLTTITDKRPTLKEAQDIVGGYVEMVIDNDKMQLMVDEEGLLKNLPFNPEASKMADRHIVGNALVLKGSAMWTHKEPPTQQPIDEMLDGIFKKVFKDKW